ncbi:N-acetyl-glucosamine-6-phosphate deacetylase [Boothiomyces sp. JEL0866]|nr:N-acetyl-glucosamine-6-phosphate deacetylase [Boothiomyces sp. JEL0866]
MLTFLLTLVHAQFITQTNSSVPNNLLFPRPQQFTFGSTTRQISGNVQFNLMDKQSTYFMDNAVRYQQLFFADGCATGLDKTPINVYIANTDADILADESFNLTVPSTGPITIKSHYGIGAKRALESLAQLITPKTLVPNFVLEKRKCSDLNIEKGFVVENTPWQISDYPQFKHRGILLDTSRHFISKENIFSIMDGMEAAKMNVFHWHIVDSQSFPLESNVVPLNAYSQWQFYSKQDVKDIIQYAYTRGIRVIPEFDMPGHTTAWKINEFIVCGNKEPWTSFCNEPPCGQIDITKQKNLDIIQQFISEQSELFSDPYLHLGSDEVNSNCYMTDPGVSKYLNATGTTLDQLLSKFTLSVKGYANHNKKQTIFWEETVLNHNITMTGSVIQAWIGAESVQKLVSLGYKVIASPYNEWYLDCGRGNFVSGKNSWCDPYKTWRTVYEYDPLQGIDASAAHLVLGGEVAMWTELVDNDDVQTVLFPRAFAAAEVLWGSPNRNWEEAIYRLDQFRTMLSYRKVKVGALWPEYCKGGKCANTIRDYPGRGTTSQGSFILGENRDGRMPDVAYTPRNVDRNFNQLQRWTYQGEPFAPTFVVEIDTLTGSSSQRSRLHRKMIDDYFPHNADTGDVDVSADFSWRNLYGDEVLPEFIVEYLDLDLVLNQEPGSSSEDEMDAAYYCRKCDMEFKKDSEMAKHSEWHQSQAQKAKFLRNQH